MDDLFRHTTPEDLEKEWRDQVDRARLDGKTAITTLQSFAGDASLLHRSLAYAREQGVDVKIAAGSDGTFY